MIASLFITIKTIRVTFTPTASLTVVLTSLTVLDRDSPGGGFVKVRASGQQ